MPGDVIEAYPGENGLSLRSARARAFVAVPLRCAIPSSLAAAVVERCLEGQPAASSVGWGKSAGGASSE